MDYQKAMSIEAMLIIMDSKGRKDFFVDTVKMGEIGRNTIRVFRV